MKKFVAVMTAAAMLTSLSACGASASTASSAAESTASSAAADSTTESTANATPYTVAIVQQLDHASIQENISIPYILIRGCSVWRILRMRCR